MTYAAACQIGSDGDAARGRLQVEANQSATPDVQLWDECVPPWEAAGEYDFRVLLLAFIENNRKC